MRAIGIDLGTTNSVAAAGRDIPRVLPNREGNSLTPSVVSFVKRRGSEEGQLVVGRQAANNAGRDPANTIFSIKRLMGRQYGERRVDEVQERYGFQLAKPPAADSPDQGIRVTLNNTPYSPPEVSAMILKQIKADAELALGEPVTHAVITVPAYFEERQRKATEDAGKLAGLTVLEIIDEPTAAALAYGMGKEEERHRVLVYDLGGGTFDISLIQMTKGNYAVLEIQGDNWLGGDDFDQTIMQRMIDWTKDNYSFDPSNHTGFLTKAKPEAESAKKALSTQQRVEILLPALNVPDLGLIDIEMELSRETFEDDIRERLERTVDLVNQAMKNQSLTPDDITAVLLVGGSTAIPMVHTLLAKIFGDHKLKRDVNPMECVALGAAIRAERFDLEASGAGATPTQKGDVKGGIQHVTPMDLGIEAVRDEDRDVFVPIIQKGTPYPLDKPRTKTFYPTDPKLLRLPVYEGLSPQASLNEQQGVLEFPLPEGTDLSQPIEVSFDYDRNRVVTVEIKIVGTKQAYKQRLTHDRGRRPPPKPAQSGTLKDDWREELSPAIRSGKVFLQGYSTYMHPDDRDELQQGVLAAEEALKAGDEKAGKRALLVIDNKIMSSGLASLIYLAERVMPRAPAKYAPLLAQAIAQLRQAHARNQVAETEKLMQTVRVVISEIFNTKTGAETAIEERDLGALARVADVAGSKK